jgi:multiple sugar transport system substrate-binding protein
MVSEQRSSLAAAITAVRAGRMSRRSFFERAVAAGASSSVALTLLAACGGPTTGPTTSITYWNLFGGGDGVRMIQMENDFAKATPSIDVHSVTLAWGDP